MTGDRPALLTIPSIASARSALFVWKYDKATWGGYLAYVRLADELWTAGERLWASGIFTAIASGSTGGEVKDALRMQLQQLGRSVAAERLGLCERIDILQRALSANLQ